MAGLTMWGQKVAARHAEAALPVNAAVVFARKPFLDYDGAALCWDLEASLRQTDFLFAGHVTTAAWASPLTPAPQTPSACTVAGPRRLAAISVFGRGAIVMRRTGVGDGHHPSIVAGEGRRRAARLGMGPGGV